MKSALPLAAFALAGAAALIAIPGALRAADDTPHDAVERLMPQLMSDDDATRADAERKLFDLGDAGRAEMERMTRESDPRRAITALRLLQSSKWSKGAKVAGEERVHRDGEDAAQAPSERADSQDPSDRMEAFRAQIERQLQEMRRRFDRLDRGFSWGAPDVRGGAVHGQSNGSIVENDKVTTWSIDADGRVKVTVKDGKDAPEQTFEAKSMEDLAKDHPDVAKRLESVLPREGRPFVFRFDSADNDALKALRGRLDPFRMEAPQTQVLGVEWSAVPDVLREQFDLSSGGMVVESIVPDSLAAKLGLLRYDVLVEVQGKSVAGSPDVRSALEGAKAGDKVSVVVIRKGAKKTLEATK